MQESVAATQEPERFTPEQRKILRSTLRWSLYPSEYVPGRGEIKAWYERKLEGLASFGCIERENLSRRSLEIMRLHFDYGLPTGTIAFRYHLSPRRIQQEITAVLDYIIDNGPVAALAHLEPRSFNVQSGCCERCGGDLYWDAVSAYGNGGDWCCIQCSERYNVDLSRRRMGERF